jgi:hypothetical protein
MAVMTPISPNYNQFVISQSDAGRELVLKVAGTNLTHDDLLAITRYITTAHGVAGAGDSAFTIAGFGTADGSAFVSGTTDTVYFRVQGTGNLTLADADAGVAGVTVTIEAVFAPAL